MIGKIELQLQIRKELKYRKDITEKGKERMHPVTLRDSSQQMKSCTSFTNYSKYGRVQYWSAPGNEKRKKEINNGAGIGHNQYQIYAGENTWLCIITYFVNRVPSPRGN